jgi:hypothetical protein
LRLAILSIPMKTLKEISTIILALPKIESGFVQQTESLEQYNAVRNASGGFYKGLRFVTEYRCFLRTSDKFAERSSKLSPIDAVAQTLAELSLPLPEGLS